MELEKVNAMLSKRFNALEKEWYESDITIEYMMELVQAEADATSAMCDLAIAMDGYNEVYQLCWAHYWKVQKLMKTICEEEHYNV